MTDEDADALLRPARRWPPLAAVAAAGLIVLPPVALAGMALAYRRWVDLLVPIVCLAVVVRPGVNLLRGNRAGVGGGLGVLALVAVIGGVPTAAALANGSADWNLLRAGLPVLSWLLLTGFLLWWPATRRWCGLLPPADSDDE